MSGDARRDQARAGAIEVRGAAEHNLKGIDCAFPRGAITVVTGVSGSGKSSLAFDTVLAEAQRRFFHTLSHYSRQFLDLKARPAARSIAGLSPAIALAQNETPPSRRATVGTLTDLGELTAVLFARFGAQHCPTHGLPTEAMDCERITDSILAQASGQAVWILTPVAEAKKGTFRAQMTALAARGYAKAFIDGELRSLLPLPVLAKEEKHTIKVVIDQLRVKAESRARLLRAVEAATAEGEGYAAYLVHRAGDDGTAGAPVAISTRGGCQICGYSWPRLDGRHFSAGSLGRCPACDGFGAKGDGAGKEPAGDDGAAEGDDGDPLADRLAAECPACRGTGLNAVVTAVRLGGLSPWDVHRLELRDYEAWLRALIAAPAGANPALRRVAEEALAIAARISEVGLGYLCLARRIRSLSGGESQRLKLAGILAGSLRGVLYVLDEPSQGLHPREVEQLVGILRRLRDEGNTILAVDHDEGLMRGADWIIDLGPAGGARGGRLMAQFRPAEAASYARQSTTAAWLAGAAAKPAEARRRAANAETGSAGAIELRGASRHNLQGIDARFPRGALTVVTGPSGAGKSTLVIGTLYPNAARAARAAATRPAGRRTPAAGPGDCAAIAGLDGLQTVELVDRRPLARSSVSIPASYLDIMGELRDLYAALPDAQVMGLTARHFSTSVEGGRCPECKGRGEVAMTMRFLADARVPCAYCGGRRFLQNVLQVRYLGLTIAEVLDLSLDEVAERFATHRRIMARLTPALDLGLGYLKLGQPTLTLSGGEAQRLKLVPHLTARSGAGTLLLLDEPTTGLHFDDMTRLVACLRALTDRGATVVAIEHHPDFVAAADWRIDLGPGAAAQGGRIVRQGPP